ncbi:MAG: DinB family protein [Verrucomicrobiota bacterium]
MNPLISANQLCLSQALELLETLDQSSFTNKLPDCYDSSIGQHLRHCIDHYQSFLSGLPSRSVDYDHRDRDPRLESDLAYAVQTLSDLKRLLHELSAEVDDHEAVQIRMNAEGKEGWQGSSVGRELQFLISHTVHHFALIGILCHRQKIPLEKGFGIAPSTLLHRKISEAVQSTSRDESQAIH